MDSVNIQLIYHFIVTPDRPPFALLRFRKSLLCGIMIRKDDVQYLKRQNSDIIWSDRISSKTCGFSDGRRAPDPEWE